LENAPSGILITTECGLKIYFALAGIEYFIPASEVKEIWNVMKSPDPLPLPPPPDLDSNSETSLSLSWRNLPFAVGLLDMIEVQFCPVLQEDEENGHENSHENKETGNHELQHLPRFSRRWNSLISKNYSKSNFREFTFDRILPGRSFRFRIKYHCYKGWSDYSIPSNEYSTLATRPAPPPHPVCTAITSFAAELTWEFPSHDNGSRIFEFVLVGRSVGDPDYIELYRGEHLSYLALGLYPEFAYSFKLASVNSIGQSDFSNPISFQTPIKPKHRVHRNPIPKHNSEEVGKAMKDRPELYGYTEKQIELAVSCRDAWKEFWDPKTEKPFYFNTILAIRQLEKPEVLNHEDNNTLSEANSHDATHTPTKRRNTKDHTNHATVQQSNQTSARSHILELEKDKNFRKKRYHFLIALHKNKKQAIESHQKSTPPLPTGGRPGSSASPMRSSAQFTSSPERSLLVSSATTPNLSLPLNNDITKLDLSRDSILKDFYHCIKGLTHIPFLRRFKVNFLGEDGIDSGGLGKEAFLLLSKEIVKYGINSKRKWFLYTKGVRQEPVPTDETNAASKAKEHDSSSLNHHPHHPHRKPGMSLVDDEEDLENQRENEENENFFYLDGLFFNFNFDQPLPQVPPTTTTTVDPAKKSKKPTPIAPTNPYESMEEFLNPQAFGQIVGLLFAKAILDGHLLDFSASKLLLDYLLGHVTKHFLEPNKVMKINALNTTASTSHGSDYVKLLQSVDYFLMQLASIDKELYNSLKWMKENDITHVIDETFTIERKVSESTETATIALCPNGESIAVTEVNKIHYLYLQLLYRFKYAIQPFMDSFLQTFHQLIPSTILGDFAFSPHELNLILNGKRHIDIEELRAYCIYESVNLANRQAYSGSGAGGGVGGDEVLIWNETHDIIEWLWRIIREISIAEKKLFIQFFTGTTCIPLDGFNPPITIVYGIDMVKNSLPKAHICFHQLVLPEYDSMEIMKEKLLFAIKNTNNFGFA
jgi:hypothetical protein